MKRILALLVAGFVMLFATAAYAADTWAEKIPAAHPSLVSAREWHAMARIAEGKVLLFGGYDGSLDDETWVYDLGNNTCVSTHCACDLLTAIAPHNTK